MTAVCRGIRDVLVTGLGATTPLGSDVPSTWAAMLAGQSGVGPLDQVQSGGVPVKVAATLCKEPTNALDRVQARTLDRVQQMAVVAAREAWADAGEPVVDPERLAVVVGSGIGGLGTTLDQFETFRRSGGRAVSPHGIPMMVPNGPAFGVGLLFGAQAGVHAPVAACASGAEAIADALELLRSGRADVVICGGAEAPIHPLTIASFHAMRAVSVSSRPPEHVSRPFDRSRDGFVISEGAAMLVLETAEHAAARGARAHAVLAGYGKSSDAFHVTRPSPDGTAGARAMAAAIANSDARANDVVHVNAHATSTLLGDVAESRAINRTLGERTAEIPVTALKSLTGHLLGASGALEAIATVLTLRDGIAPPTRNLQELDDQVDLDVVTGHGRAIAPGLALSNSFGFGGHNVVLAFAPAHRP